MPSVTRRPIDQLTAEWRATSRSPESRRAARLLASVEEPVAALAVDDLGELVDALRRARGTGQRASAALVLRAMLRSQSVHPLVPRAVLQAMLPGLVTVARRLSWGAGGDWADGAAFFGDVLTTAWEVITDWAGEDRGYAVLDLLSAIRCRLRRQLLRQRSSHQRVVYGVDLDAMGPRSVCSTTDLDELARAIDDLTGRGLEPTDAAILYGSRVLGLTVSELSSLSGLSRHQLDDRRHRAVQRLCDALV
ncbi:MAG: hypothetical protein ACYC0E_16025 [Acidimicrobiales bacterium]